MQQISVIGLDIAKTIFQVHAVDRGGEVLIARSLKRKGVLAFFSKVPPCLVGMEACGTAYHWAREITKFGHTVRLMPPRYVKAYVKRGKTDAGDAAAICEAVSRPSMTFVPIKSAETQAIAMLHSTRRLLIGQRTQSINSLRGHLAEFGIVAPQGLIGVATLAGIVRDESDPRLPLAARVALSPLVSQIEVTSAEIAKLDRVIAADHKTSETSRNLATIPSVGAIVATAIRARIPNPHGFRNGRHMAAWLGLVPEQDSSAGKTKQKGISKKGDRYLRQLLVTGAMAVIRQARKRPDKHPWLTQLLARTHPKVAAVALANKTARIAWAILVRGGTYQAEHRSRTSRLPALAVT